MVTKRIKKTTTYEENIQRLNEIISMIESGEIELKDAIDLYKESMERIVLCSKELDSYKQVVEELNSAVTEVLQDKK